MSFPRWPINDPMLKDNKPLPVWQRWLSSVVAQLINGVFQTIRVTGPPTTDGTVVALTVGDSAGFVGPSNAFGVISNGLGQDAFLYLGETGARNFTLGWTDFGFSWGAQIASYGYAFPLVVDGSVVLLQSTSGGNVGVGLTTPTARLHIAAGTATAETAPLKLTPGTLLTVPELGAVEFTDDGADGHLYITLNVASVLTRVQIV